MKESFKRGFGHVIGTVVGFLTIGTILDLFSKAKKTLSEYKITKKESN